MLTTVAAALAVTATPASAAALTVTPGGLADGVASPFVFTIDDPVNGDLVSQCDLVTIHLDFDAWAITGSEFQGCSLAGFIPFDVTQIGVWSLSPVTFDQGTGVTTFSVDNVAMELAGPGCDFTLAGIFDATFTNDTSVLSFLGNPTLTVVDVAPAPDNCSDLVHEGDPGSASADFLISPPQVITP